MNVLRNWFRSLSCARRSPVPRPHRHQGQRPRQRPHLEELESRTLLSVTAHFVGTQLIADGDGSGNTIRVDVVGSGDTAQQRISYLAGGSYVEVGRYGGFSSLLINSGTGNDTVNINGIIYPGSPLTINGNNGQDVVNLNDAARNTTVHNDSGFTDLHLTDPLGAFATTATVTRSSVTLAHPPFADSTYMINYTEADLSGLAINLGNAANTVVVNGTPQHIGGGPITTVVGGAGVNMINVRGTNGSLSVEGHSPNTTVNVGNLGGGVQDIHGEVKLLGNFNGRTTLNVDDTGDTNPVTASQNLPGMGFDIIHNLAPADIIYRGVQTGAVDITLGSGANTFTVENTNTAGDGSATTLNTGPGNAVNIVYVLATNGTTPLTVIGHGPNTTVNVGNSTNGVQDIKGTLTLQGNFSGRTTLNVDDTGDTGDRLTAKQVLPGMGFDIIRNLAPADILYRGVQTGAVTITLGSVGANTFTVENTNTAGSADATTLNTGAGNAVNIVNVLGIDSTTPLTVVDRGTNTTVNVGNAANRLDDLHGPLTVTGAGTTTLNVKDQGTTTDKAYEIYANTVKRVLNPDPRTYDAVINYGAIGTLTVNGSSGYDVFEVEGTAAGTNTILNGSSGGNEFLVSPSPNGSDSLLGPVAVHGRPGVSYMVYSDAFASAAQTSTLTANTISRTGAADVTFDNLFEVIFAAAIVGGNTINVQGVAAGVTVALNPANGDSITIGANQTLAAILGSVIVLPDENTSESVVIDDSANATPPAGAITFSNDVTYGFSISGLIPGVIYLSARQNTTLTTSLLTGAGDKTFNLKAVPQGVALTLDAGSGTNTLDYTGYAGNVVVDLPLGTATGFSGISHIQNVIGASGGPAGSYNILVGNGGNVLTGGNGRRNLLIAGASASTLIAGNSGDILIGGTTDYDTDAASLLAIVQYWAGTDDYGPRVANLTSGTGVPLLDASTVHGNGGGNTLQGGPGLNLFYGDLAQDAYTWDPASETFVSV
jgi:serralysin